jgi:CcdB protein
MAQFDVYLNPIAAARHAYPYVVAMQSEFSVTASDQIVAPVAPRESLPGIAGRLTPIVVLQGAEHAVLMPRLTVMRSRDLGQTVISIATSRAPLLAAIDYLFFGV